MRIYKQAVTYADYACAHLPTGLRREKEWCEEVDTDNEIDGSVKVTPLHEDVDDARGEEGKVPKNETDCDDSHCPVNFLRYASEPSILLKDLQKPINI